MSEESGRFRVTSYPRYAVLEWSLVPFLGSDLEEMIREKGLFAEVTNRG